MTEQEELDEDMEPLETPDDEAIDSHTGPTPGIETNCLIVIFVTVGSAGGGRITSAGCPESGI